MIIYYILFIMLFPFTVSATEDLKIELENHNNNLRFCIINYGHNVLINKRFSIIH